MALKLNLNVHLILNLTCGSVTWRVVSKWAQPLWTSSRGQTVDETVNTRLFNMMCY